MPKNTQIEKDRRRDAIILASKMRSAKKAVRKYFPNGIEAFDSSVFEKLFDEEDQNDQDIERVVQDIRRAHKKKDRKAVAQGKAELRRLHTQQRQIEQSIKEATNRNSIYYRAAQPYLDAKKLLTQQQNYTHLDEILARYDASRAAAELVHN